MSEQEVYCSEYCSTVPCAYSKSNIEMPKQPINLPDSNPGHSSAAAAPSILTKKNSTRFACRQQSDVASQLVVRAMRGKCSTSDAFLHGTRPCEHIPRTGVSGSAGPSGRQPAVLSVSGCRLTVGSPRQSMTPSSKSVLCSSSDTIGNEVKGPSKALPDC